MELLRRWRHRPPDSFRLPEKRATRGADRGHDLVAFRFLGSVEEPAVVRDAGEGPASPLREERVQPSSKQPERRPSTGDARARHEERIFWTTVGSGITRDSC